MRASAGGWLCLTLLALTSGVAARDNRYPGLPEDDPLDVAMQEETEGIGTLLLAESDLLDANRFFSRLRLGADPVSRRLRDDLAPGTRRMLGAYTDPEIAPSAALRAAVVEDLNRILRAGALYDGKIFRDVPLSRETRNLLQRNPSGLALVRLNRMLIEDVYSGQLARIRVSPMDIKADTLDYEADDNLMIATGNVVLRRYDEVLRSDYAVINMLTYDVLADGRVSFERGNNVWVGDRLNYNFHTQRGDFGVFRAFLEPFHVQAATSVRTGPDEFLLTDVQFSTCEGEEPAAYLHARTARIIPGHSVRAYNVVMYLGGIPVFYSPFWFQNIGTRNFISITPGYSRRMGFYLLTAFNYRLSRHFEAATHVDVRTRRGLGVGQDIMWSSTGNARGLSTERYETDDDDAFYDIWMIGRRGRRLEDMEEDRWYGDLITYYTRDSWPEEGKKQKYPIDEDRYRLRLYHNHSLTDEDYLMTQLNYLSDPRIIQQFFRDEYKTYPEPENFMVLGRRTQNYALSIQSQMRFNDFYTTVDRVPEAALDISRQQIGDSRFYYESENAAGYLRKQWESNVTNRQDYSIFRADSSHSVNYPVKFFGFLNVIPRVGYRGTYFSRTKEDYDVVTETIEIDTNDMVTVTSTTNTFMRPLSAEYRSLYEAGCESSLKAFKIWETHPGEFINNLRHIVEPYVNYTYIPEPNVRPDNLYQFDAVDELDRRHDIRLGLRNKFQTKRRKIYDLLHADIYTHYRFSPEEDQNQFSEISFNLRSEPLDWLTTRVDGNYDQYESEFRTLNTRLTLRERTFWACSLEHRYRKDRNSLLNAEVRLQPFINWGGKAFTRYDFQDGELEAYGVSVRRIIDCIAVEVGYTQEDDDFEVWLQFWFTEFPRARVSVGL